MPYRPYDPASLPKPGNPHGDAKRSQPPRLSDLRIRESACRIDDVSSPGKPQAALLPANRNPGKDFAAERRRSEHEFAMAMYAPLIKALDLRLSLQKLPGKVKELVDVAKFIRDLSSQGVASATAGQAEKALHKALAKEIIRRNPELAGHEKLIERTLKDTISMRDRIFKEGGGKIDREYRLQKPTKHDAMP